MAPQPHLSRPRRCQGNLCKHLHTLLRTAILRAHDGAAGHSELHLVPADGDHSGAEAEQLSTSW